MQRDGADGVIIVAGVQVDTQLIVPKLLGNKSRDQTALADVIGLIATTLRLHGWRLSGSRSLQTNERQ
jgi:hypothetical protein